MDWKAEANAVIDDIRLFVNSIEVSDKQESSDMRIYFTIVTLEGHILEVMMDSSGFSVCDTNGGYGSRSNLEELSGTTNRKDRVYETINALLDDNSVEYRKAFAQALSTKINSLESN